MSDAIMISFHPSLSGPTPVPWPTATTLAHEAGFVATDIVLPEVAAWPANAARETLEQTRLVPGPASLPVEFRLDEDTFQRDLAELPRLAAFAAAIGIKTMFRSIPASSNLSAAELSATLRRRVSTLAKILGAHDIDIALEVLGPLHRRREAPHEFIWRLPDGADFAHSCGPGVGLLVDSWHWHHSCGTAQEIIELGGMIRHVHVADAPDVPADAIRDDARLLPGNGVIDHTSFFAALRTAGYKGFVSPEIRGYRCEADAVECARNALEAVCECLTTGALDSTRQD